jgi:hypothetical protein
LIVDVCLGHPISLYSEPFIGLAQVFF